MAEVKVARMRTIKQCLEYFHKEDPESSISEYYLRTLIKRQNNKIPIFRTGNKVLVNLDGLLEYLNSEPLENSVDIQDYGKIRRIVE